VDLEIRHLLLVAGIADAGSMTKAADRLHLTQSALSHQLRDIEGRVGTPFFTRPGRRMVLTAAGGASWKRHAASSARWNAPSRIFSAWPITAREPSASAPSATPGITGWRRCWRCSSASIRSSACTWRPTRRPRRWTRCCDGRVDLAILIDPPADPRLRYRPLFHDEMVAVVAKSDPLARKRWLTAEDLAAQHLLLYTSVPEESFVLRRLLGPAGLTPARISFIMLTEAMIELARAGTGVGILPRWSAQRAIGSGAVVAIPLTRKGMRRQWAAATLAAQDDPPS
jgi:LysR family transcriptional regulator for metE and metH